MDKNNIVKLIKENKELFDLFVGLYTLLGSVQAAKNIGLPKKNFEKVEEDIKNDLEKIKKILNITSSPEEDKELKNFALKWGESQFNQFNKDH